MKQSNKEIKENLSTESKQKDSLKEIFEKFINELSICRPDIDTNMVDFEIIKKKTNQLKSEISQKIKELEKYKIKFNRLNNQFKELDNEKEKGGIITIHSVDVVTPELISKHMFSEKIPKEKKRNE